MARRLPHLNALRAFEAAARRLSFIKAALELKVTPAAVSHQIKALEVLAAHNRPVTKSAMVVRDIDILGPMAEKGLATVAVSVTSLDHDLSKKLEPRAPIPEKRLETIRRLSQAGIPVSVLAAPMIPFLNDSELEAVLGALGKGGGDLGFLCFAQAVPGNERAVRPAV
jgi:uncharacterized Fe-S cluster-containing radical SAM superfamily enzyme